MRKFTPFLFLAFAFVSLFALGDDVTTPLPDAAFWSELLKFLGGVKGASVLVIAASVTQLVMVGFRTSLGDFAGPVKLLIVTGLSVVGTVLGNLVMGLDILPALLHGSTIAAIQVFIHQIVKQKSEPALVNPIGRV